MAPKIQRLTDNFLLGEAPHWDVASQSLFFLDIFGKLILKYELESGKISKVSVGSKQPSFIIPIEGRKDQFLLSLDRDLVVISWDGESDKISVNETLCTLDNSTETLNNKINDGKCDFFGRLWTGTYGNTTEPKGTLYSFDPKNKLKKHFDKICISNGIAFNQKTKKMYFIDSMLGGVDQFDFDVSAGAISNRQALFTFKNHNITGMPDGMTIDTDGNLWVATFGGSKILKISGTHSETLLDTIEMPAVQVTSMVFGGPNLDELFVTTGAWEIQGQKLPPPENGATYRVTETGSKGYPSCNFKLF